MDSLCLIYQFPPIQYVSQWIKSGYQCIVEVLEEGNTVRKIPVPDIRGGELSAFFEEFLQSDYNILVYKNISLKDRILRRIAVLHGKSYQWLRFRASGLAINVPYITLSNGKRPHLSRHLIFLDYHPGLKVIKYSPSALAWASRDVRTILITGTNGKTTVTKMIYGGFRASGIPAACNRSGANIMGAIITPYINNICFGCPKAKWAVIECDERHIMEVAPIVRPEIIVVTNISTDQVSRLHGVSTVKRYIERSIRESNPRYVVCNEELKLDIAGTSSEIVRFSPSEQYHSAIPGRHNILNVAAAITVLKLVGLDSENARQTVFNTCSPPGRFEQFQIKGRDVTLMLAKNPVGLSISLEYAAGLGNINLVVIMNDYLGDDKDPGWLINDSVAEEFRTCNKARLFFGGSLGKLLADCHSGSLISNEEKIIPIICRTEIPTVVITNYSALYSTLAILKSIS